jgi:hypothetical protein
VRNNITWSLPLLQPGQRREERVCSSLLLQLSTDLRLPSLLESRIQHPETASGARGLLARSVFTPLHSKDDWEKWGDVL